MQEYYSYHIFYFPFKWEIPGEEKKLFSDQVDLEHISISNCSNWERVQLDKEPRVLSPSEIKEQEELFGERQYYYDFVHPVLYDMKGAEDSIIHHYERREPKERLVEYSIELKHKTYVLRLDALNVNLYSTGVGIMSFYLKNEREDQSDESSIRDINQFGRRIMPPHAGEFMKQDRGLVAQSIRIEGLDGDTGLYMDSFDYIKDDGSAMQRGFSNVWEPSLFIKQLIFDLSSQLKVTPVIDDRMLVNCWYCNNELSGQIKNDKSFVTEDLWYKYVFVDNGNDWDDVTCLNDEMKKDLLKKSTYSRWQKKGTLYGISRYSMVALMESNWFSKNILAMHMRTIYSRMFELVIIQRASMLRFSSEVTKVSSLKGQKTKDIAERVNSLYKEYIRFINQIYFRNVTAQDQGIELYEMLLEQFNTEVLIKDLDEEISELHQYITLKIDQRRSENGDWLNKLAAIFLPASLLTGVFGMNPIFGCDALSLKDWGVQLGVIFVASIILMFFILRRKGE